MPTSDPAIESAARTGTLTNTHVVRMLYGLTRPYPWAVPSLAALSLVASLAEGLGIGLMIPLLDRIIGGESAPAGPLATMMQAIGNFIAGESHLIVLGMAIVFLIALKTLVLLANIALATRINARITHDLRVGLSERLLKMPYGHFARREQGRLMNTLEAQTYRTGEALTYVINLISAGIAVAATMGLLLLLSWQMTLLVAVVMVPVSLLVRALARRAQTLGQKLVDAYAVLSGRMLELLGAMRTIRLFNQEAAERERIARAAGSVRSLYVRTERLTTSIPALIEFLYLPVFLMVLTFATTTGIGVPSLLAFIALLYRMQPQLKILDHARVSLGSYAGGIAQVAALLQADDEPRHEEGHLPCHRLEREIEFQSVSFSHAGADTAAVNDVSFTLPKGAVVAVVGGSGAGKSTLVALLCRLYEATSGAILVDGVPLPALDLRQWRSRIAFAGQDSELLEGTIRDNIRYGAPGASDAQVTEAARLALADEFIRQLPRGYDTEVGGRGLLLSGGQRQRIALARALVRKADLLILDEATNAVDNLTERAIQEAIAALAGTCTILIIAHRLGTIRGADYVLVMANGRVVEQGKPSEVLARGGPFFRLHSLQ